MWKSNLPLDGALMTSLLFNLPAILILHQLLSPGLSRVKVEEYRRGILKMTGRQGQRLGNYRLIRLLGEGGFAEVYLGEACIFGTRAAIKILLVRLADEEMERFLKEARTIAGLNHPTFYAFLNLGLKQMFLGASE